MAARAAGSRCARPRALPGLAAAVVVAAIGSCASVPVAVRTGADYLDMLPPGETAYAALDVARTREILPALSRELGFPAGAIRGSVERMQALYGSVLLELGRTPLVCAVAAGDFPPALVRAGLCRRRGWTRVRGSALWHVNAEGLQVAVRDPGAMLLANGRMEELVGPAPAAGRLPPDVAALLGERDLVVFFPAVPSGAGFSGSASLAPVKQLWLTATLASSLPAPAEPLEIPLEIALGFRLSGEREARLFRPILRLLLLALSRQGSIPGGTEALSGIRDEVLGNVVRLEGIRMSVGHALQAVSVLLGGPAGTGGEKGG